MNTDTRLMFWGLLLFFLALLTGLLLGQSFIANRGRPGVTSSSR
jgi:hypothetical protein